MRSLLLTIVAASVAASGCTHAQLRRSTVKQSGTVADIYQQQVLNNLAKFVHDANALPDFGVPTDGLAQIDDGVSFTNDWTWETLGGETGVFGIGADRDIRQSWSLKPVQDPRKLELMRCAYQRAVGYVDCSSCCIDCEKRFRHFYTGKVCDPIPRSCLDCPSADCLKEPCAECEMTEAGLAACQTCKEDPTNKEACEACQAAEAKSAACQEGQEDCLENQAKCKTAQAECKKQLADEGIVTSNCLESCWFHVGCTDHLDKIRKNNPCCLIGEHCGTVVWVCPGRGTEQLTKLTIAILDYAVNDPKKTPEPGSKEVTGYFDASGEAVTADKAVYVIKAKLPVTDGSKTKPKEATENLNYLLLGEKATASQTLPVDTSLLDQQEVVPTPAPPELNRSEAALRLQLFPGNG